MIHPLVTHEEQGRCSVQDNQLDNARHHRGVTTTAVHQGGALVVASLTSIFNSSPPKIYYTDLDLDRQPAGSQTSWMRFLSANQPSVMS